MSMSAAFEPLTHASHIERAGYEFVDTAFGRFPETPDTKLAYHNGEHPRLATRDVVRLGQFAGFSALMIAVAQCAMPWHDAIQGKGRGIDESESAELVARQMTDHGFDKPEVEAGRLTVIGTEPRFVEGRLVSQKVVEMDFPSRVAERIARAGASADLGRIYMLDGPYFSHLVYKEINNHNRNPENLSDMLEFLGQQEQMMAEYVYPLSEAEALFRAGEARNRRYNAQLIADIQAGRLETWQDLMNADQAFMTNY